MLKKIVTRVTCMFPLNRIKKILAHPSVWLSCHLDTPLESIPCDTRVPPFGTIVLVVISAFFVRILMNMRCYGGVMDHYVCWSQDPQIYRGWANKDEDGYRSMVGDSICYFDRHLDMGNGPRRQGLDCWL